jgi:hypothetical protein
LNEKAPAAVHAAGQERGVVWRREASTVRFGKKVEQRAADEVASEVAQVAMIDHQRSLADEDRTPVLPA